MATTIGPNNQYSYNSNQVNSGNQAAPAQSTALQVDVQVKGNAGQQFHIVANIAGQPEDIYGTIPNEGDLHQSIQATANGQPVSIQLDYSQGSGNAGATVTNGNNGNVNVNVQLASNEGGAINNGNNGNNNQNVNTGNSETTVINIGNAGNNQPTSGGAGTPNSGTPNSGTPNTGAGNTGAGNTGAGNTGAGNAGNTYINSGHDNVNINSGNHITNNYNTGTGTSSGSNVGAGNGGAGSNAGSNAGANGGAAAATSTAANTIVQDYNASTSVGQVLRDAATGYQNYVNAGGTDDVGTWLTKDLTAANPNAFADVGKETATALATSSGSLGQDAQSALQALGLSSGNSGTAGNTGAGNTGAGNTGAGNTGAGNTGAGNTGASTGGGGTNSGGNAGGNAGNVTTVHNNNGTTTTTTVSNNGNGGQTTVATTNNGNGGATTVTTYNGGGNAGSVTTVSSVNGGASASSATNAGNSGSLSDSNDNNVNINSGNQTYNVVNINTNNGGIPNSGSSSGLNPGGVVNNEGNGNTNVDSGNTVINQYNINSGTGGANSGGNSGANGGGGTTFTNSGNDNSNLNSGNTVINNYNVVSGSSGSQIPSGGNPNTGANGGGGVSNSGARAATSTAAQKILNDKDPAQGVIDAAAGYQAYKNAGGTDSAKDWANKDLAAVNSNAATTLATDLNSAASIAQISNNSALNNALHTFGVSTGGSVPNNSDVLNSGDTDGVSTPGQGAAISSTAQAVVNDQGNAGKIQADYNSGYQQYKNAQGSESQSQFQAQVQAQINQGGVSNSGSLSAVNVANSSAAVAINNAQGYTNTVEAANSGYAAYVNAGGKDNAQTWLKNDLGNTGAGAKVQSALSSISSELNAGSTFPDPAETDALNTFGVKTPTNQDAANLATSSAAVKLASDGKDPVQAAIDAANGYSQYHNDGGTDSAQDWLNKDLGKFSASAASIAQTALSTEATRNTLPAQVESALSTFGLTGAHMTPGQATSTAVAEAYNDFQNGNTNGLVDAVYTGYREYVQHGGSSSAKDWLTALNNNQYGQNGEQVAFFINDTAAQLAAQGRLGPQQIKELNALGISTPSST